MNQPPILDLLEWIGSKSRPYNDVMEAWRTTCPGLTIRKNSVEAKFVSVHNGCVRVTAEGLALFKARRKESTTDSVYAEVT